MQHSSSLNYMVLTNGNGRSAINFLISLGLEGKHQKHDQYTVVYSHADHVTVKINNTHIIRFLVMVKITTINSFKKTTHIHWT